MLTPIRIIFDDPERDTRVVAYAGRAHYTDMNMLAGNARRSAEAVREMLDRAEAELLEIAAKGDTALVPLPAARRKIVAN